MVVIQDSPYTDLQSLAGQPVGVEIGSRSEQSLRSLNDTRGLNLDIRTFFSEGAALDALTNGEVQGMVGELDSLSRAGRQHMRLIDEPVLLEPYAIVDAPLGCQCSQPDQPLPAKAEGQRAAR